MDTMSLGINMDVLSGTVIAVLATLLLTAAWCDLKAARIPNVLVLIGLVLGVLANGLLPSGFGFNRDLDAGGMGWVIALEGIGYGLVLLLPLYLLGAMGAGDVKLMAMVGAFVGPAGAIGAVLFTFLAGGAIAVALALRTRMLIPLLQNVRLMLLGGLIKVSAGKAPVVDDLPVSVGKLPYGVAIALGTLGWLAWERWGTAIEGTIRQL